MPEKIIDGITIIVSDIDQYLQINDISGSDLIKIWGQIETDYALYEKWICYHHYHEIPFVLLDEMGAVLEDDCVEMRLTIDNFKDANVLGVVRITEENFDMFAAYHNKRNPESGAKSELIKRNFSNWVIFALLTDNKITDYIVTAVGNPVQAEIYCIEAADGIKCRELIISAAQYAFNQGKKEVLYMADGNTVGHQEAMVIGFIKTGFYKGYKIKRPV